MREGSEHLLQHFRVGDLESLLVEPVGPTAPMGPNVDLVILLQVEG